MRIEDRLIKLNSDFENLHHRFTNLAMQAKGIEEKYAMLSQDIHEKYIKKEQDKNELKDTILKFYRIAKENATNELRANDVSLVPDISKLNNLVNEIDISNPDDVKAREVVNLASKYIVYINAEISKIASEEQVEQRQCLTRKDAEMKQLTALKQALFDECKNYLNSENVLSLVKAFGIIEKEYEITSDYLTNWSVASRRPQTMLYGYQQYYVDCPTFLLDDMERVFGKHFNKVQKMINCPCGYDLNKSKILDIEYTEQTKDEISNGIQALILNILKYYKPSEYRVTLIDQIHYNPSILGKLSSLITTKNSFISKVPYSEQDLQLEISKMANYYREIERLVGYSTVHEFNAKSENVKKIPMRLLIINKNEQMYNSFEKSELMYLLNNAEKFGLTIINMTRKNDINQKTRNGISLPDTKYIKTDSTGNLCIFSNERWASFKMIKLRYDIPSDFIQKVLKETVPVEIGTQYLKRYKVTTPKKSIGKRKPIEIPFSIDDNDKPIYCSFENENFAAYMMGASRSGKSTLLHMMISHLIMNYHPDEVELWLMDFKMTEFKRYAKTQPAHLKYLLLEKSSDLVFDVLDKMTEILKQRQIIFSNNGWSKIKDVPADVYMPVIFVIIDEFSQMSQLIRDSLEKGYHTKLENLLKQGGAFGFKFIFADQTYTTGVTGLTQAAREQIQLRFALYSNEKQEIKETLFLSSNQVTDQITDWITSMPVYHTLFKWRDNDDNIRIGLYKNMYIEANGDDIERIINTVNSGLRPVPKGTLTTDNTYIKRTAICVEGQQPRTIDSMLPIYSEYESHLDADEFFPEDILVYPGVPCSFNLAKPFVLKNSSAENILLIKDRNGSRDCQMSVVYSIMKSFKRKKGTVEVWGHQRSMVYSKYKTTALSNCLQYTDLGDICNSVKNIKESIQQRKLDNKLVLIFGYENICDELESLSLLQANVNPSADMDSKLNEDSKVPTLEEIMEKIRATDDIEERKRIKEEYNRLVSQEESVSTQENKPSESSLYNIKDDINLLLKVAPQFGVHFVFCFEDTKGFIHMRLPMDNIIHKVYFSMSLTEANNVGIKKAGMLETNTCFYINGAEETTFRPHIHPGIKYPGWRIDAKGEVVEDIN